MNTKRFLKFIGPWIITFTCFGFLYNRLSNAAQYEGMEVAGYLGNIFSSVDWIAWLCLMIPYSFIFLIIDTCVLWRTINWWNAPIKFRKLLPLRASAYIISILNEQIGKGTIALYINRKYQVPGWELGSTMLIIMYCELIYLLLWASLGVLYHPGDLPGEMQIFHIIPVIGIFGTISLVAIPMIFRNVKSQTSGFFSSKIFHSVRKANFCKYLTVMAIKTPSLLIGVWVYSKSIALFGIDVSFREMLSILPVIFFGTFIPGPFRAVAVSLWPALYSDTPGAAASFGFVQHNFFILFNATIGLLFLSNANRNLKSKI